jgi:hypothetical protein
VCTDRSLVIPQARAPFGMMLDGLDALIVQSMARKAHFAKEDALGGCMRLRTTASSTAQSWREISGMVHS